MTLVELTLSLAVSAMVVTAIASLSFAVSHAWSRSEDVNEVVNHGRNGMYQMSDRLRMARAVGYTDADSLLIWREDANGDGYVNEGELSVFAVQSGKLCEGRYVFGANVSQATQDANNGRVSPGDFVSASLLTRLRANPYFQANPLADYVESAGWSTDAAPPSTRLVTVTVRIGKSGLTQCLVSGTALRAPAEVR